ncbi:MAG: WecB/TagA/CpsF family glycosyltransferase [Acidimicrobiales bacterium]
MKDCSRSTIPRISSRCTWWPTTARDATAARAKDAGATVHEYEVGQRGKGPALNWLVSQIAEAPDAFVIIDADTAVSPDILGIVDRRLVAGAAVVQMNYGVKDPDGAPAIALRSAAFALRHRLRPAGRHHLGLSAGLFGNGMVFRASVLEQHQWSNHLTEDIEMHLALVRSGVRVEFEPFAVIEAEMPDSLDGARQQHLRWEQGRMAMARASMARLPSDLAKPQGTGQRVRLIDSVLDQLVPPFSITMAAIGTGTLVDVALWVAGGPKSRWHRSWILSGAIQIGSLAAALRLADAPRSVWIALLQSPAAILWKLRLYLTSMLGTEAAAWTRTTRNAEPRAPLVAGADPDEEPPFSLVGGVPAHQVTEAEAVELIGDLVERGRSSGRWTQVCTVNTDYIVNARHDAVLAGLLGEAGLLVADGMPVVWASRWYGHAVPERVTGADLVPLLAASSAVRGHRIALFGAREGVATAASDLLRSMRPELTIEGFDCPVFDRCEDFEPALLEGIRAFRPDIVLVALGHPKQEYWIQRFGELTGASVLIGVGGALDFLTGEARRAPRVLRSLGLEWAHRLVMEPRRLGPRYARDVREALVLLQRPGRRRWVWRG